MEANRTKQALADSLCRLMEQQPLSKISIADICAGCGMHRKSFYYHFQDKYELVSWIYDTGFRVAFERQSQGKGPWELLGEAFSYFYENRTFYRGALAEKGQNSFYEYFGETAGPFIAQRLLSVLPDGGDRPFYVRLFTNAIRNALVDWLEAGTTVPPEKLVTLVRSACCGVAEYLAQSGELQKGDTLMACETK